MKKVCMKQLLEIDGLGLLFLLSILNPSKRIEVNHSKAEIMMNLKRSMIYYPKRKVLKLESCN